jgi:AraC-like DNA-binding protein
MKRLFSTANVHPRDRFDYWHSLACKNLVGHSSKPACRQTFQAEIEAATLVDIGLVLFSNSPMDVARTTRDIAQSERDDLFVCRQVTGALGLEQDGRQVMLESGDITLLDPFLPYMAKFLTGSKLLVLKVPRRALEARIGKTRELVARSIRPFDSQHSWTSAFLAMLPDLAGNTTRAAEDTARELTLQLVASSLVKATGSSQTCISSIRSMALLNVRAAIESRLSDPALDAATVAKAAGVSVRYANSLLAEENTSIMRLTRARRLERCRKALEDPLQNHRTLSEIAYGWGFSDMTHFGRSFKAMYGVLPRDYRQFARRA